MGNGERVWVLGKVAGDVIRIKGNDVDKVEKYVLFSTGHDGRTSVQVRFTPVRVVCQNTLLASLVGKNDLFKIYHVPGMRTEISEAQAAVERILKEYGELAETYDKFADRILEDDDLKSYLSAVFPDPKRKKGQTEQSHVNALHKVEETRDAAAELFKNGKGNDNPPAQGSLWAAYNGIVELVDHYWSYSNQWQRLDSVWFGDGMRVKEIAFAKAKELVPVTAG